MPAQLDCRRGFTPRGGVATCEKGAITLQLNQCFVGCDARQGNTGARLYWAIIGIFGGWLVSRIATTNRSTISEK